MNNIKRIEKYINHNFLIGILMTLIIALVAKGLVKLPFLTIMGQLVVAIIIGMAISALIGVKDQYKGGITFSSKKLLRIGIVLLGMSLNFVDLYEAGLKVFMIALINLAFAFVLVYLISKLLGVGDNLSILTASGTAICGASAIVAIAPQIKANENEIAMSAAIISLIGTAFTIAYSFSYNFLSLTPDLYGIFAGGTLHEVAHVVAAAGTGGATAVDLAVIVKLSRVALLVPVALLIGFIVQRKQQGGEYGESRTRMNFPWFILGFLTVSAFNSLGIVSETVSDSVVSLAYLFLAMAMAGLGLNVQFKYFKSLGMKPFVATLIGSILLSIFGYIVILVFYSI